MTTTGKRFCFTAIIILMLGFPMISKAFQADSSVIFVRFENAAPSTFLVISYYPHHALFDRPVFRRIPSEKKSDTIRIGLSSPMEVNIYGTHLVGRRVIISPGDTLTMQFTENSQSLTFSGKNAALNQIFSDAERHCIVKYHLQVNQLSSGYLQHFARIESSSRCRDSILDSYKARNKFPEWFNDYRRSSSLYGNALDMLAYLHQENYRNPSKIYANPEMLLWFRHIALNNAKDVGNIHYLMYLWQYYLWKNKIFWVRGTAQKVELAWFTTILPDIRKDLKPPVYDWFVSVLLANYYAVKEVKDVDKIAELVKPGIKDQHCIAEINQARDKALENKRLRFARSAKVGSMAPGFYLKDSMNVNYSIERFRGKWTLIAFYDSESCSSEDNVLETMKNAFSSINQNLQVVNIYTDADVAFWKKKLAQNPVPGVHLFSRGNWGEILTYLYGLESFPYFVLVDAGGVIQYSKAGEFSEALAIADNK